MAYNNVGFRLGLQEAADQIIAAGAGAEEGSFYLTSDSHRLYIGAQSETNASNITLYAVNEGVTRIQNLTALQQIAPTTDAEKRAMSGRFYYLMEENILAVFNGKVWVQINEDTDNSISSIEFTGKAENNKTTITESITDASGNKKSAAFSILTDEGITSDFDVATKTLTISGDSYTLTTTSSTTNEVTLHLESANTDTDSDVVFKSEGSVNVSQTNNVITISAEDCEIADVQITNIANGMQVTVTDSKGNSAHGEWTPIIAYGGNKDDQYKVQFNSDGIATLDVYGKEEIDRLLDDLNGMTYKGTVGSNGSYGSGFRYTPGGTNNAIIDRSGNSISCKIGDMVALSEEVAIGNNTYGKGTIVICRSTDNTEDHGYIPSNKLDFDIIEADQNSDTQYMFKALADDTIAGIKLESSTGDNVGELLVKEGSLGNVTINGVQVAAKGASLKITHEDKIDPATGISKTTVFLSHELVAVTIEQKDIIQDDGLDLTFTAVQAIETDDTGHITKIVTGDITVKDMESKVSEVTYATEVYEASDKRNVGVVTNKVTTEDFAANKTSKQNSFTLVSKSLTITNEDSYGPTKASQTTDLKEGLSIEMTWGSF